MSRAKTGWIAGLLMAAALALWAVAWATRADYPFLAAERFLQGLGVNVTRTQDLRPLNQRPASSLSLLLLGERGGMSAAQAQALLGWVYAGGRLLVTVQGYWTPGSSGDPLLGPLNIRLLNAYASAGVAPMAARSTLTKLYLESQDAPLQLGFAPGRHLEDADDLAQSWANSPQGTHMLQLSLGAGTLTVVSDTGLWRNHAIGQFDNAWLLWYLNQGREVIMQYRAPELSLLSELAKYPLAWACAALLLIVLGAWAVSNWVYTAPHQNRRPTPPTGTLYRSANRAHSLRLLREDLQRYVDHRHPGYSHLAVAEQWQLLAKLTQVSTAEVAKALRPSPARRIDAATFREQVARLQALRNAL